MVLFVRGLVAAGAVLLVAAPALGFDLIAGPAEGERKEPAAPSLATPYAPTSTEEYDRGGLFDEFRIGALDGLVDDGLSVGGISMGGAILFDPLLLRFESAFASDLLSPRPHLGFTASPDGGGNQLFAGFTWDVHLTDLFFVEAGFAGAVHDRQLEVEEADADRVLGCRFNFRQSAGAGVELGGRLRLVATVDHATDGGLCGGSAGLTHAGAAIGYKF